jgi:nicotinamidase-related amidase
MVAFFVDENPYAQGIVANINTLAATLRSAGGCVAWIVPAPAPSAAMREFYGDDIAGTYANSGGQGPLPSRLGAGLTAEPADMFLEKSAASAFFPGACDLSAQLDRRRVDTVLIAGTVANVCCESTVRDASTLGYRTIMVADANAAVRDQDLDATLHTVYRSFGDVRSTADLVDLLG